MLMAASVIEQQRGYDGTSMTKTWLMRRAVRRPVADGTTAPISSSVWRLPFISDSTSPARAISTALAAAAWLCSAGTIRYGGKVDPFLPARPPGIFSSGPTSTGRDHPGVGPLRSAPSSESRSQGWTTAHAHCRQSFTGPEESGERIAAPQCQVPAGTTSA